MRPRRRRTLKQLMNSEELAHEAYGVFMQRHRASRVLPKDFLKIQLTDPEVYTDFLKLCMEYDYSDDLSNFREGLAIVIKMIGPIKVAKASGINRVTLYRMLGNGGNPSIKNLIALLHALNLGLWVVDKVFYNVREQVRRKSTHRSQ